MKKKLVKKLTLNRETIRDLNRLDEVAGGTKLTARTDCLCGSISDPGCICNTDPGGWTC